MTWTLHYTQLGALSSFVTYTGNLEQEGGREKAVTQIPRKEMAV